MILKIFLESSIKFRTITNKMSDKVQIDYNFAIATIINI